MSNGTGGNTSVTNQALLDFIKATANDCIPDAVLAELIRRIIVIVTTALDQSTVYSAVAPDDKNANWVPIDQFGNRTGPNKRYDYSSGTWVVDNLPKQSEIKEFSVTANGDIVIEFTKDFPDLNYMAVPVAKAAPAAVTLYEKSRALDKITFTAAGWASGTQEFKLYLLQLETT